MVPQILPPPHKKDGKILYKKDPKIFTFSFIISARPSFCAHPNLLCYRHTPDKKVYFDHPTRLAPHDCPMGGKEGIYPRWNTASLDRQKSPPLHNIQVIPPIGKPTACLEATRSTSANSSGILPFLPPPFVAPSMSSYGRLFLSAKACLRRGCLIQGICHSFSFLYSFSSFFF